MDLYRELQWREMLYDSTEGVREALAAGRVTGYIGFDPTAASLHVGSLLTILGLTRLQRAGHAAIAVVGGGTGMIGDPSGKSQERVLLSRDQIEANVAGIRTQLARFLDRAKSPAEEMSAAAVLPVEPLCVDAAKVLHPARQVGLRRVDDEVEVIAHQAVGPAVPAVARDGRGELADESPSIRGLPKDDLLLYGKRGDVMCRVRNVDAEWPRHQPRVGIPDRLETVTATIAADS